MFMGDVRDSRTALTHRLQRERRRDAPACVLVLALVAAEDRTRRCHRQDAAARLAGVSALGVGLEQALQLVGVGYDYERTRYRQSQAEDRAEARPSTRQRAKRIAVKGDGLEERMSVGSRREHRGDALVLGGSRLCHLAVHPGLDAVR
jgi:hypothetical protein